MTIEKINKYLKDCMAWNFTDFFYAYCEGKDITDPEYELTEEEYDKLERECADKITYEFLSTFCDSVGQAVNERIYNAINEEGKGKAK